MKVQIHWVRKCMAPPHSTESARPCTPQRAAKGGAVRMKARLLKAGARAGT